MNDKERFDAFMSLADFWVKRRATLYQAQLHVSVGLWTLLAAAMFYLKVRPPEFLFAAVLLVVSVGHTVAIRRAQVRNWEAWNIALGYVDSAIQVLMEGKLPPDKRPVGREGNWIQRWFFPPTGGSYDVSVIWAAPTFLLALLAYLLIGR